MGPQHDLWQRESPMRPAPSGLLSSLSRQSEELKKNLSRPLGSRRIALCRPLILRFPHFQGYLESCSSSMSLTGMFVPTENPEPQGSILDLDLGLADGLRLIKGTAEVMWVRTKEEATDYPPGMGLRFVRLDTASRRLIRWTVEKQVLEQGRLVELKELLCASKFGQDSHHDLSRLYPFAGAAESHRETRRRWFRVPVMALLLLLIGGAVYALHQGNESWRSSRRAASMALVGEAPKVVVSSEELLQSNQEQALLETVEVWAQAWSNEHVGEYLALHSEDLREMSEALPEAGPQVSQPRFVKLTTTFEAEYESHDRALVRVIQSYESNQQRDSVNRTLDLVLRDGTWEIIEERTEEIRTPVDLDASALGP